MKASNRDYYVVFIEHVRAPTPHAAREKAGANIEAMPASEIAENGTALEGDSVIAINTDQTGLIFPKPHFVHIKPSSKQERTRWGRQRVQIEERARRDARDRRSR